MNPESLKPILTKQDQVVEQIREQIIAGEYARGERLKQAEIAEKLGVSITPVREALMALEMEGYVKIHPNRGVYVPQYSESDVREIFELRLMLEEMLVVKALDRLQRSDILELQLIQEQFLDCLNENDYVGMRVANVKFHFCIYEKADCPQTFQFVRVLWAKYPFNFQDQGNAERFGSIYREHQAILDMLDQDDKAGVLAHFKDHLVAGRKRLDEPNPWHNSNGPIETTETTK